MTAPDRTETGRTAPDHAVTAAIAEIAQAIGTAAVELDPEARERLSRDEYRMSPVLRRTLPVVAADAVVTPISVDDVVAVMRIAVAHGVPVTPRGKGTGNYGQAVPMAGGILLDLSRLTGIEEIGDASITALAGTRIVQLEQALRRDGRQLLLLPSTMQSTIGGFLAGGTGGSGSIEHGFIEDGFVLAIDVVLADGRGLVHLEGDDVLPYLHAYGTTGIIVRVTVAHEPERDWTSVLASFEDFAGARRALMALIALEPAPRIASTDMAEFGRAFPKPMTLHPDTASLRTVVDRSALEEVESIIASHGGVVERVEHSLPAEFQVCMLGFNHATWHLISAEPDRWFHAEAMGTALVERADEVLAVWPGAIQHLDAMRDRDGSPMPIGMIVAPYTTEAAIFEGVERLRELGLFASAPHSWTVNRRIDLLTETAAITDPGGILNPGKLPRG